MLNIIKFLYLLNRFNKNYNYYLETNNTVILKKTFNYALELKENYFFSLETTINSNNLDKNIKILQKNAIVISKLNDLLFLNGDLEKCQEHSIYLKNEINRLSKINNKEIKNSTHFDILMNLEIGQLNIQAKIDNLNLLNNNDMSCYINNVQNITNNLLNRFINKNFKNSRLDEIALTTHSNTLLTHFSILKANIENYINKNEPEDKKLEKLKIINNIIPKNIEDLFIKCNVDFDNRILTEIKNKNGISFIKSLPNNIINEETKKNAINIYKDYFNIKSEIKNKIK